MLSSVQSCGTVVPDKMGQRRLVGFIAFHFGPTLFPRVLPAQQPMLSLFSPAASTCLFSGLAQSQFVMVLPCRSLSSRFDEQGRLHERPHQQPGVVLPVSLRHDSTFISTRLNGHISVGWFLSVLHPHICLELRWPLVSLLLGVFLSIVQFSAKRLKSLSVYICKVCLSLSPRFSACCGASCRSSARF